MSILAAHHLSFGTLCPLAGRLSGSGPSLFSRGELVCHCVLLETARDGLILIDTGFGAREHGGERALPAAFRALIAPRLSPADAPPAQLARLGFRASDVRHVVVTHLDLDHAGGLDDFPDATVHLHAREHAAAIARATTNERGRYVPAQWAHGPKWQLHQEAGDTWRGLPAISRLPGLDADVGLLPMHGHTRGHSAVIANVGARWLVHAGDAYMNRATVDGTEPPLGIRVFEAAIQLDGTARRASAAALRELKNGYADLDIFCSHDTRELAALQAANRDRARVG